jgi:hypothetical protein
MSFDLDSETKWSSDTSLGLHVTSFPRRPDLTGATKINEAPICDFRAGSTQAISGRVRKGKLEGTT